ncbi:MAG: hemerythrin domain-containing protein [Bdellovibrio sp.]
MYNNSLNERRHFLNTTLALGVSSLAPSYVFAKEKKEEAEVGPAEDLMREHGALNRILLIYEEGLRRLNSKTNFDIDILKKSAMIIKNFIEDYHEKLEEEFIFPRMRKAEKLVDLVNILENQHKAGRKLTTKITQLSVQSTLKNETENNRLKDSLQEFIKMYRPHESREDTVLFPTFHNMLKKTEYEKLGDQFEDKEHQLFGKDGFETIVDKIAELEKNFEIYDISKFTPS